MFDSTLPKVDDTYTQHVFKSLYRPLVLSIHLWMMSSTHAQIFTQNSLESFQKFDVSLPSQSHMIETGIPCLVTTSFRYILASWSNGSFSLIGKKWADLVSRSMIPQIWSYLWWLRKFRDKIYGDIVLLLLGYPQLYQQSWWSLVFSLDFSTCQTLSDIHSYVSFHVWSPV